EGVAGGDEVFARRRVDAVVAGPLGGRARDADVHLLGARVADHLHDLAARGAADDRVIDDDDAPAAQYVRDGAELQLDAEVADRLLGLDEGAADVVAADQAELEGDVGPLGVTEGRGDAGVRHRDDDVAGDGQLLG